MAIQEFFDKCEDNVELFNSFEVQWSMKGVGFGSFYFRAKDDGTLEISNECMSKTFIKKVLCQMVDDAKLDDEPTRKSPIKVDIPQEVHDRAAQGTEPTEDAIIEFMRVFPHFNYESTRERLREEAYGGKPPAGYESWGDYWNGRSV